MMKPEKIGVVLSGGGARGAYQVGVLNAVCEISKQLGIAYPFSTFSGISVGAINSALFASYADDIQVACYKLVDIWSHLHTNMIIRTGAMELGKAASRMVLELTSGRLIKQKRARSLLDNFPLSQLIEKEINFQKIQKNLSDGVLSSLAVTAVNYSDGKNYIFFQADKPIEAWVRERRIVQETVITKEHILASSALPLYFPPQKIGDHYFADGNIRNSTPLSPPIKLGAKKLLIIPLNMKETVDEQEILFEPSLGRMISVLLNALLLDAVDFDLERLKRINETLSLLPSSEKSKLKNIDVCMIRPSENLDLLAQEDVDEMPGTLRYFLEGLGSREETGGLISTLLFEPPYTKKLIELGYQDARNQEDEIAQFLSSEIVH